MSPTECFLRYLTLPDDDTTQVDLRQCAVVLMSHLDRLSAPYMPPAEKQKVCLNTILMGFLLKSVVYSQVYLTMLML